MILLLFSLPVIVDTIKIDSTYLNSDAVVLFVKKEGEYVSSGACRFNTHRAVYLLNERGVKKYSQVEVPYTPSYNKVIFHKLTLHKKDGRIIDYPLDDVKDIILNERVIFWEESQKVFNFSDAEPGDVIEYSYEVYGMQVSLLTKDEFKKYIPPMKDEFYYVEFFQEDIPLLDKKFIIKGPKNKVLKWKVYRGDLKFKKYEDKNMIIYEWEDKNIKSLENEDNSLPLDEITKKLVVTTISSWKDISRWMFNITEPVLKTDENFKKKVNELTNSLNSEEEKIYRLFRFVADSIRYLGTSMGEGEGYTPHPVIMTLKEREGVCKDKAALLVAMLREIGLESYICMSSAMRRIEDIPANQFDHAVTCIRKDNNYIFLDPTWSENSRELFSKYEQFQSILPATPEGETLMMTPISKGKNYIIYIKGDVNIEKDGFLRGKIEILSNTEIEKYLRTFMRRYERKIEEQKRYLKEYLLTSDFSIDSFFINNLYSDDKPLEITIYFTSENYTFLKDNKIIFKSLGLGFIYNFEWFLPRLLSIVERKTPIYSVYSIKGFDIEFRYNIPKKMGFDFLPQNQIISNEIFSFDYIFKDGIEKIHYTFDKPVIYPEELFGIKEDIKDFEKKMKQYFILGKVRR